MKETNNYLKRNNANRDSLRIERRLEALIVLVAEMLSQDPKNENWVNKAKAKTSVLLMKGGISQDNVARLLRMKRNKVTRAKKKVKL